jgi:hypothetical protein
LKGRCLISFFGQDLSGTIGQVIEVQDQKTFDDLVQSGYIEPMDTPTSNENVSTSPDTLASVKSRKQS